MSSLHVLGCIISFNNLSLLVVISFDNYDNSYNIIMIMVNPIVNFHLRYIGDVFFASAGMYNTF